MNFYCIADFKNEFEKLLNKKSYRTIEEDLIDYFFKSNIEKIQTGIRLNNSIDTPYIKKRLDGCGGFRIYFLLITKKENIYFLFVTSKDRLYGV